MSSPSEGDVVEGATGDAVACPGPRAAVVGAGRAGTHMAGALVRAGWLVTICRRGEAVPEADVTLLAVRDAEIEAVASTFAGTGRLLAHLSGALGPTHAVRIAIHPAMTFPARAEGPVTLEGIGFALSAADDDAARWGRRIVADLGGMCVEIPAMSRGLYHAACTIASPGLIALEEAAAAAAARAGVPEPRRFLAPLVAATMANWTRAGGGALSGAVARGDEATIAAHMAVLEGRESDLYRAVVAGARHLVGARTEVVADLASLRSMLSTRPHPVHLVPTMGALHAGHAALIRAARAEAATVVVSVFVNPLQFNEQDDLARYPRTLEADLAMARSCGADVVWAPDVTQMYPKGKPLTTVSVDGVASGLEGTHRPGHFDGVATVVTKLFSQTRCDAAWFGRKDAQQLAVIKRVILDLDLPVSIREHPTVREPEGLALSSRNVHLSVADRAQALLLSAGLFRAASMAVAGEREARALISAVVDEVGPGLEYAALVDAVTFRPLDHLEGSAVLVVAAMVGSVRLIDNVYFCVQPGGDTCVDRGMTMSQESAP